MTTEGYVYVMSNEAYTAFGHGDHVYKVGKAKNVEKRLLAYTTQILTPTTVAYASDKFNDYTKAEGIVKNLLKDCRIQSNREFFRADIGYIINRIELAKLILNSDFDYKMNTRECAMSDKMIKYGKLEESERLLSNKIERLEKKIEKQEEFIKRKEEKETKKQIPIQKKYVEPEESVPKWFNRTYRYSAEPEDVVLLKNVYSKLVEEDVIEKKYFKYKDLIKMFSTHDYYKERIQVNGKRHHNALKVVLLKFRINMQSCAKCE
tara:strand:- start:185 stop:973 length:789 start_codon:yes stop_codon:yes gene_type:complete